MSVYRNLTRMTTFMKAKHKKSDKQTNIDINSAHKTFPNIITEQIFIY